MRFDIAIADQPDSLHWRQTTVSREEFETWFDSPADEKECGNYVLGKLERTTRTDHGEDGRCTMFHRTRAALVHRCAITLDVDFPDSGFLDRVKAQGWDGLVHSSFKSMPEAPRYRLIVYTDRFMTPSEYTVIARYLMHELGHDNFDPSTWQPERYMYKPSAKDPDWYERHVLGGSPLTVDWTLLDAAVEGFEAVERESEAVEQPDVDWPPATARELEKAAYMLADATRGLRESVKPNGEPAAGRNEALYWWLLPLYSFVKSYCLEREDVDAKLWDDVQNAPGPDEFAEAEFNTTADSAWSTARAQRPEVVEADDVFTPIPLADALDIPVGNFIDPRDGLLAEALMRRVLKYVTCAVGELDERFYIYDHGVWQPGARQIGTVVSLSLGNAYRKSHLGTVLDKIKYEPSTPSIDCGPTPRWINCRNGLLDWRTGELFPHTPDVLSTTQVPVEWNPDADCPKFEQFLREVLPADCLEPMDGGPGFVWEMLGYFLYSGNPHHIAVLLRGKGRNGKGVFLRVLERLLGTQNVSSVTLHDLADNRFRAASLYGKIANIAGDLDPKWLANTATFKAITGGDSISAEHKYGAAFNFTPWAVPVYSANKVFGSADSSEGYFARWVVVPFPNSFLGREDRHLDARLGSRDELEGVLRRAAEALPVLMRRGRLPEPATVKAAKHEFVVGGDRIRAWIDEHYELDREAWTARADLFEDFAMVADFDAGKPMSRQEFYNRLEGIDGVYEAKRNGVRGFRGIRLQDGK